LNTEYTIKPLSERALLVQFKDELDVNINSCVISLHQALNRNPFPGFVESVPGYSSLGVFFDVGKTAISLESSFKKTGQFINEAFTQIQYKETTSTNIIEIPVFYGGAHGPDINYVADKNNISVEEVIAIHCDRVYSVFMIGFLPGFPYLGITDKRITVERKATPRLLVHAGSVALAGNQTGIYTKDSPGGWQIIGRTDIELFNAQKDPPNFLKAGDMVRFVAV
jgi:inhibitor of KinA